MVATVFLEDPSLYPISGVCFTTRPSIQILRNSILNVFSEMVFYVRMQEILATLFLVLEEGANVTLEVSNMINSFLRLCPGRFMALASLWIAMTGILTTFNIEESEETKLPDPARCFKSTLIRYVFMPRLLPVGFTKMSSVQTSCSFQVSYSPSIKKRRGYGSFATA